MEATADTAVPRDVVAETPPAPAAKKTLGKTRMPAAAGTPTISLASVLDLDSDVHKGKGIYHSGTFIPDARFFVLAVCTFYGRVFSAADFEASQFVTPPSMIAHALYCLYFLLFHRDMHSKSPSLYARQFTDFARYAQMLKLMENVFIPDEIFSILTNFSSFTPDLIPNLQFTPTLGSTLGDYDIPYLVHPLIFLHGHNTLFNRADALGHFSRFLGSRLFTYTNANPGAAPVHYSIGNLLGCVYPGTPAAGDARIVQNWFSRIVLPFVDPATHRQHLRRTGIARFDLTSGTYTSANWNPYTFLFSSNNSSSFEAFLDCIHATSEFARDQFKASRKMSDLYQATNPAPGSYMIMSYSTPTWHTTPILDVSFPNGEMTSGNFDTLHTDHTKFGIAPTAATNNANNLTLPTVRQTPPTATSTVTGFIDSLYLAEQSGNTLVTVSDEFTVVERSEMKHTTPNVLVFAPADSTVQAAQHPMLAGIIVHNGNIDSTILRTPNPDDELPLIRSRYIDGFVSLRVIRPRFASRPTWLVVRQAIERMSYTTINLIWRSDMLALPRYDVDHNAPNVGAPARLFWPFTFLRRVTQMVFGTNVLVSNTAEPPADPRMMQVADAWSSFRLTSDPNARPSVENTFFGINHGEVIFGRNSTLNKFSHPSDLLRRN
jgi:hypothetical protein